MPVTHLLVLWHSGEKATALPLLQPLPLLMTVAALTSLPFLGLLKLLGVTLTLPLGTNGQSAPAGGMTLLPDSPCLPLSLDPEVAQLHLCWCTGWSELQLPPEKGHSSRCKARALGPL